MHIGILRLALKTLGAPFLGISVFSAIMIFTIGSVTGYGTGSAIVLAWGLVFLRGVKIFTSWSYPITWTFLYFGIIFLLVGLHDVSSSLLFGLAVHAFYALTKVRCTCIGCCNFSASGRFGRGTVARQLHLGRFEIVASISAALVCVVGVLAQETNAAWIIAGIPAHGLIRYLAWTLRGHGQFTLSPLRLFGAEALVVGGGVELALYISYSASMAH